MRSGYKFLRQLNDGCPHDVGSRNKLDRRWERVFADEADLPTRLARALAEERALPIKELFESFEFFARVRKLVRAPVVADLCAGHGLTGVLFALFERSVERVVLLDQRRPECFDAVMRAANAVAPWVEGKVEYRTGKLKDARAALPHGTSVVAVHACGARTDQSLDVAVELRGRTAVMPCCYPAAMCEAPATLVQHLGLERAFDVDRTYRLERAGYRVRWDEIPREITPMARVLVAVPAAPDASTA